MEIKNKNTHVNLKFLNKYNVTHESSSTNSFFFLSYVFPCTIQLQLQPSNCYSYEYKMTTYSSFITNIWKVKLKYIQEVLQHNMHHLNQCHNTFNFNILIFEKNNSSSKLQKSVNKNNESSFSQDFETILPWMSQRLLTGVPLFNINTH